MTWAAFLSIALIHLMAAISPGPSFVVSVKTAAAQGFGTAVALALGFALGAGLWAAAALAGLAVLFELVPGLFAVMKIIGGVFLLWIAIQLWRHAPTPMPRADQDRPTGAWAAFRLGVLTFVTNPKPAVFFGAVFVGLVPPGTPLPWLLAIIAVVMANELLWYVVVARLFSLPRPRAAYGRAKTWIDRGLGGLIAAFGAKIALG